MKKLNIKLVLAGLAGAAALYFIYKNQEQKRIYQQQLDRLNKQFGTNGPPANTPAWQQWVGLILSVYGQARQLWEPGGIFYRSAVPHPDQDPKALEDLLFKISQTKFIA